MLARLLPSMCRDDTSSRIFCHEVFDHCCLVSMHRSRFHVRFSLFSDYWLLGAQLFLDIRGARKSYHFLVVLLGSELCPRLRGKILTAARVIPLVGGGGCANSILSLVSRGGCVLLGNQNLWLTCYILAQPRSAFCILFNDFFLLLLLLIKTTRTIHRIVLPMLCSLRSRVSRLLLLLQHC